MQTASGKSANDQADYSLVLAAGAVAGTVQLIITCPVELIKIKLQTGKGVYVECYVIKMYSPLMVGV